MTTKGSNNRVPYLLGKKTKIPHTNKQLTQQVSALYSNCPTFSEAVASLVPLASKARAANGLSWAGIMLAALWKANTQTLVKDVLLQRDKQQNTG